jgi:uncharacterized protein YdaU (DUF1376 family)
MHKYQFNIGDYYKKAGRLSMLQHGAYRLLLDAIYDREVWPTREQALEWTWASTPEQEQAIDFILGKFFTLIDGAYQQTRIAEELAVYHAFIEKQAANGRKGGKPKGTIFQGGKIPPAGDDGPKPAPDLFQENPLLTGGVAKQSSTNNQQPTTDNQSIHAPIGAPDGSGQQAPDKPSKVPRCPVQEIINLYRLHCPSLIQPRLVPDATLNQIGSRWRQSEKHQTLEFWERFFKRCESSDFLAGRTAPSPGRRQFRAGLEWVVGATNFAKIINGNYHAEQ